MNENVILEARQKIGLFFKELRQQKKMSQIEVADLCGITYQTLYRIEQGQFNYGIDVLLKLCQVLEFTLNFEVKEVGNKSRFVVQESESAGFYICTDTENNIVCRFQKGKFNETQTFTFLEHLSLNPNKLATLMREFGDYLAQHHADIF